jgi:hypothetical protein
MDDLELSEDEISVEDLTAAGLSVVVVEVVADATARPL